MDTAAFDHPAPVLVGGKPVVCGLRGSGEYVGPCDSELGPDRRSTLCDEARGVCVAPEVHCVAGWCYVPPRSYLSGVGVDREGYWGALDAAISVVPRGFYAQATEFTRGSFAEVMGYLPQAPSSCGPECPVSGITIFEAMEVANRLSDRDGLGRCYALTDCGFETLPRFNELYGPYDTWACQQSAFAGPGCSGYRLPSRAEWELAAGGGSPYCLPRGPTDPWSGGAPCADVPAIDEWSISCSNADFGYRPCYGVRSYILRDNSTLDVCLEPGPARSTRSNDFGLYDVFGNAAEYVQTGVDPSITDISDWPSSAGPYEVAPGEEFATEHSHDEVTLNMGGAFESEVGGACRWAMLAIGLNASNSAQQFQGFRLVRTAPEYTVEEP